ncbi:MAG: formyltransferase family protein [Pseudomonadota bacterium]
MTKVLLLTKTTDWCNKAAEYLKGCFKDIVILHGERNDVFPEKAKLWGGDIIISYLCPWIVPKDILDKATSFVINFHPAPPEYPGIGCYNFAIYDGAGEYGVTCHHMDAKVDSGKIVAVKNFPLDKADSVKSLKDKSLSYMYDLLVEVIGCFLKNNKLPESDLFWARKPFTRKQLNELCLINPSMNTQEIAKRVRATTFPGAPGAYVELAGYKFGYMGETE